MTASTSVSTGSRRWVAPVVWLALALVAVALDGATGGAVAVLVGAVVLARAPRQILGGIGVLCLLGVPIAVVARGVPSPEDVSPFFVVRSLLPHHLMFAGLALVGSNVVLDLASRLRGASRHAVPDGVRPHRDGDDPPQPVGAWPGRVRVGVFAIVVLAGLAAAVAVWGQ